MKHPIEIVRIGDELKPFIDGCYQGWGFASLLWSFPCCVNGDSHQLIFVRRTHWFDRQEFAVSIDGLKPADSDWSPQPFCDCVLTQDALSVITSDSRIIHIPWPATHNE